MRGETVQVIVMLSLKRPTSSRASRPLVGLDIEPGAVNVAQVRVNGELTIEQFASVALDPGVVRDGEITDVDALSSALKTLFAEHKLAKRVRIGIANQRVVVRHMLLPPIPDPKELATAVRYQADAELPMPIDEAVLEHVSLGIIDTPMGPRQRVLLVAARRDMIDRLLAAVRQAGLKPEGIDLSAFGMIRALPVLGEGMVMHLSVSGITNLALSRDGECVFTRMVAHGVESMAGELAARKGITVAAAREAFVSIGMEPPAPPAAPEPPVVEAAPVVEHDDEIVWLAAPEADVAPEAELELEPEPEVAPAPPAPAPDELTSLCRAVLNSGVRRIAGEVRNSIDFHMTAGPGALGADGPPPAIESVLLTGRAVAIPGFAEALSRDLGLRVEVVDVRGADPAAPGSHAVAAGLAIEEAVR